MAKNKQKIPSQFAAAKKDEVPFAIILGEDELKAGFVTVKEQRWRLVDGKKDNVESQTKGIPIKRDELVQWLKNTATLTGWASGKLVE